MKQKKHKNYGVISNKGLAFLGLFIIFSIVFTVLNVLYGLEFYIFVIACFLTLSILFIDLKILSKSLARADFEISRTMPHTFAIDKNAKISLQIKTDNSYEIEIFDFVPESFICKDMPFKLTTRKGQFAKLEYEAKPMKRGNFLFDKIQLRITSKWGFYQINRFVDCKDKVRVYPNFGTFDKENLVSDLENNDGNIVKQRKRGTGTDFSQLRDYIDGDTLRQIDYKASSRMNKLISREYQVEKDQQVLIMLDCSRRMQATQGDKTHFDYALNSITYLARTILNEGDALGIYSFGGDKSRYMQPRKGRKTVNNLLNQVFDLYASKKIPDYVKAAEEIIKQQKRRSLIILVTNLHEEDGENIRVMLKILQRKHIVLIVNMKEEMLEKDIKVDSLDSAIFYASRNLYKKEREDMLMKIKNKNLIFIDTLPTKLSMNIINIYLNVKQSGIF